MPISQGIVLQGYGWFWKCSKGFTKSVGNRCDACTGKAAFARALAEK